GRLQATNGDNGDSLGWSVALSGDGNTVVSGGPDEDSLLTGVARNDQGKGDQARDTSAGAAWVFVRDSNGKWTQQAFLKAVNTRKNDQYGTSAAISDDGNTVAIGSHFGAGSGGSKGVNADPNDDAQSGS